MSSRLNVSEIVIGKRYRKDHGELDELRESIEKRGLINPITIRRGENLLLAGGRRFECLKQLGITELVEGEHFRYFDDLDDPVAVEFDENVIRKSFLPSEKVEIAMAMERHIRAVEEAKRVEEERVREAEEAAAAVIVEAEPVPDGTATDSAETADDIGDVKDAGFEEEGDSGEITTKHTQNRVVPEGEAIETGPSGPKRPAPTPVESDGEDHH